MEDHNNNNIAYAPVTLDFVTVGVEFCSFLEKTETISRSEWMETMMRILPLLYVKATLLPPAEVLMDDMPEVFVTEQDYLLVANRIASLLGEDNVYLDVFVEDMKYSDRPVSSFISEDIADVYQDVRNFISVYQHGIEEAMIGALNICKENFKVYWGQKLVNVLRPFHSLVYKTIDDNDINLAEEEDSWV